MTPLGTKQSLKPGTWPMVLGRLEPLTSIFSASAFREQERYFFFLSTGRDWIGIQVVTRSLDHGYMIAIEHGYAV